MSEEKEIVYVDMDGVLADFPEDIDDVHSSIKQECKIWCEENKKQLSDYEGIFATISTRPGAVQAIERLIKKYDVYVLSTAPWANTSGWSDKRVWVGKHLPKELKKRLILTHKKNLNRGRWLIDDRPNNGADKFDLHDGQEWIHFGSNDFPDWDSVLRYLGC